MEPPSPPSAQVSAFPAPRRLHRGLIVLAAAFNLLVGVVLITTTWNRAFGGTGGEDTLLFQLVTYALIALLVFAALAVAMAIRYRLRLAAVLGAGLIAVGIALTLFTVFQVGLPDVAFGIALIATRPRSPAGVVRGPPRMTFAGSAAFNLFFGAIGFSTVGLSVLTGGASDATSRFLAGWTLAALALGAFALVLAVWPSRRPSVVLGIALIVLAIPLPIILFPILPIALAEIVLGLLVLRLRNRIEAPRIVSGQASERAAP